jgi:glycosyltransferase involved in cell wall biosynthesis
VIDDGSTDRSKTIIESVNDERINLVSRENRGLIATLNEGVQLSKGKYIARMDADDICLPDRFTQQIEYFESHSEFGVIFTGLEYIDAAGNLIRKKASNESRKIESVELLFGCPVCHPTAMFNMNVLKKEDIRYDPEFNKAEDFELWTRLASMSKIGILSNILFQYRIHADSITSKNNTEQRATAVRAITKNLSHVKSAGLNKAFSVVYNNHQGDDSLLKTFWSFLKIFFNLKRVNSDFSYKKFLFKAFYLLRGKINYKSKPSLRG